MDEFLDKVNIDMSDFWAGFVCGLAMGVAIISLPVGMTYWLT